jgi:hypothetical protein
MSLKWKEGEETVGEAGEKVNTSVNSEPDGNINLTKEQMKVIMDKFRRENPDDMLQPLILKGVTAKSNRFYILKAITMQDMGQIEDLMSTFEEEELKSVKASARKEWFRLKAKDGLNLDEDKLNEDQANDLKLFIDEFIKNNAGSIGKRVNEYVVNVVGVIFPKDHAKKVTSKKIPYGDLVMISSSAQVFSGWSDVEMDLEAYSDSEIEQIYDDL